jgi:hypothetical protein
MTEMCNSWANAKHPGTQPYTVLHDGNSTRGAKLTLEGVFFFVIKLAVMMMKQINVAAHIKLV